MARPTKLTPAAHMAFVQALAAGASIEVAARIAGFSRASAFRYLTGSKPEEIALREAAGAEIAKLELRLGGTILRAALDSPRWAAFFLERRFPARWAPRTPTGDALTELDALDAPAIDGPDVVDPSTTAEFVQRLLDAGRHLWATSADVDLDSFEDRGDTIVDLEIDPGDRA